MSLLSRLFGPPAPVDLRLLQKRCADLESQRDAALVVMHSYFNANVQLRGELASRQVELERLTRLVAEQERTIETQEAELETLVPPVPAVVDGGGAR